jgi:hypothetical protein
VLGLRLGQFVLDPGEHGDSTGKPERSRGQGDHLLQLFAGDPGRQRFARVGMYRSFAQRSDSDRQLDQPGSLGV